MEPWEKMLNYHLDFKFTFHILVIHRMNE